MPRNLTLKGEMKKNDVYKLKTARERQENEYLDKKINMRVSCTTHKGHTDTYTYSHIYPPTDIQTKESVQIEVREEQTGMSKRGEIWTTESLIRWYDV